MDTCEVCLENNGEISSRIQVNSKKWKDYNFQNVIEKHLWWWSLRQPLNKNHTQWICQQCWQELYSFQQFAQRVKKSHKLYRVAIKIKNIPVVNEAANPNRMVEREQEHSNINEDLPGSLMNPLKRKNIETEEVHIKREPYFGMDDDDDSLPEPSRMVASQLRNEPTLPNSNYSITLLNEQQERNNRSNGDPNERLLEEIKYLIASQTMNIKNIFSDQTQSIKSLILSFYQPPKYLTLFPIKSVEELINWETSINEDNKHEMIKAVSKVLGDKGIIKGLPLVIAQNLLIEFNLDGLHNKMRLKNYPLIMEVLFYAFTATSGGEKEPQSFETDLRKAFKNAKNRHFKDACIKNKKLKLEESLQLGEKIDESLQMEESLQMDEALKLDETIT